MIDSVDRPCSRMALTVPRLFSRAGDPVHTIARLHLLLLGSCCLVSTTDQLT
jgi:hypothetical protein